MVLAFCVQGVTETFEQAFSDADNLDSYNIPTENHVRSLSTILIRNMWSPFKLNLSCVYDYNVIADIVMEFSES